MTQTTSPNRFQRPLPGGGPDSVIFWAMGITVAILVFYELTLMANAYRPSVMDDGSLWASTRAQVRSDSLVVLGTSRIQAALSSPVLEKALAPRTVVQLAIRGADPLPILEDLAADTSFRGLVFYEFLPALAFGEAAGPARSSRQYVAEYHRMRVNPLSALGQRLKASVESRFAFRQPFLSLRVLQTTWREGRVPKPSYTRLLQDRRLLLDFRFADERALAENLAAATREFARSLDEEGIQQMLERHKNAILAIEGRGGRVVLLKLPTSGPVLQVESELFPDELYWARVVENLEAPHYDLADYPAFSRFPPIDGSHIDGSQKVEFTRTLLQLLQL